MVPIACNLSAINTAQQPLYAALMKRIQAAVIERTAVPGGYAYRLDSQIVTPQEVEAWMSMEGRCCPFLKFQLSESVLTLTGPEGTETILDKAFERN